MNLDNFLMETKLDYKTLQLIPFIPGRVRIRNFKLKGEWGNTDFTIKAQESVNTHDLITLMFVTKAYLKKNWYAGYLGEGEEKREIAGLELNLEAVCKERGILNKKINRETLLNSLIRLSNVNLFFINKKLNQATMTKYLYEISFDLDYKKAKIYANKKFIEFISDKGILLNLSNFVKLERSKNKAKDYAILLYAFMSGTKTKAEYKGKTFIKWREKYNEEMLFNKIKLNETKLVKKEKRRILKEAFNILHTELKLPKYTYNTIEKMWIRCDLIEKRNNKIK